jgi:hypothetical protein
MRRDRGPVQEARDYAHEFLAYRKKEPTPYMGLRFLPNGNRDADERVLSDDELLAAEEAGRGK